MGGQDLDIWVKLNQVEAKLQDLQRRLNKVEAIIYGNGQQGILSRLATIEAKLEDLKGRVNWAVMLTVGTFLGIIVTIISILLGG